MSLSDRIRSLEKHTPRSIPLKELDLAPGPFCTSFGFDPRSLANSIDALGLVHAPWVKKEPEGWTIVTGYRRVHAVSGLGWEEVPCRDVSDGGLSHLECLLVSLHENLGSRAFNDVEKGMVLMRLSQHLSQDEVLHRYMPLLGLPSNRRLLETLIRVTREFPDGLLNSVARGALSMGSCRLLLKMSAEGRQAVSQVLSEIPFNRNQQRQFVDWIADVSESRKGFASRFLAGEPVRRICEDSGLNGPQKASALLRWLREEKFPLLTQAEHQYNRAVAALQLPKGTRIRHDPGFEAPSYVLEVEFTSGEGLLHLLREVIRKEGWERLGDPWKTER